MATAVMEAKMQSVVKVYHESVMVAGTSIWNARTVFVCTMNIIAMTAKIVYGAPRRIHASTKRTIEW